MACRLLAAGAPPVSGSGRGGRLMCGKTAEFERSEAKGTVPLLHYQAKKKGPGAAGNADHLQMLIHRGAGCGGHAAAKGGVSGTRPQTCPKGVSMLLWRVHVYRAGFGRRLRTLLLYSIYCTFCTLVCQMVARAISGAQISFQFVLEENVRMRNWI